MIIHRPHAVGFALLLAFGCSGRLDVSPNSNGGTTESSAGSSASSGGKVAQGAGGSATGAGPSSGPDGTSPIVSGSSPDCPPTPVEEGQVCSSEGSVCAYRWNPGDVEYRECGCWTKGPNEFAWHCYSGVTGVAGCPGNKPPAGSSCFGSFGTTCSYPVATDCNCDPSVGTWACHSTAVPQDKPPTLPNPDKPITSLSDAERTSWCQWYVGAYAGVGFPAPPDSSVDAEGYTTNNACRMQWDFPCNARIPGLSVRQCVANLTLSTCQAPVSALSDCISTVFSGCQPAPHGCVPYTSQPGCDGTMLTTAGNSMTGTMGLICTVRVQ